MVAETRTTARSVEPANEFAIKNIYDFSEFMTSPKYWESNYKVILASDIDIQGATFEPIKEFSGVFDGCGYKIINLKLQNSPKEDKDVKVSFIETLNSSAEIKNVTFDNYTIEGNSDIKKAAGLIISNHGTVSGIDIMNSGINKIAEANTAGFVLNNEEDGLIENCHIKNVDTKDSEFQSGFVYENHGKIKNSETTLSVKSKSDYSVKKSDSSYYLGGFISKNHGTIENCTAYWRTIRDLVDSPF